MAKERNDDDTLYQALIVEDLGKKGRKGEAKFSQGIRTTLITRPRSRFPEEIQKGLPSKGVELLPDFLPPCEPNGENQENLSKRYGARTLLQYRKISQLVAKSWLPGEDESVIRKLILTANLAPDDYCTCIPQRIKTKLGMQSENDAEDRGRKALEALYYVAKASGNNRLMRDDPPQIDEINERFRTTIILPDGLNWEYLRLSLLCAGQAYLKTGEDKYVQINEPIMSTYDICVVFAFTMVSWSDYIATFTELVQPGSNQKPPYYKVTFPYPPRPNLDEFTGLSEDDLETWANAPETDGELPFYPPIEEGEYVSDLVKNIVPPYPYIPPTTT